MDKSQLRQLRAWLGMTQQELAKAVGSVSQSEISSWEAGGRIPPKHLSALEKLAQESGFSTANEEVDEYVLPEEEFEKQWRRRKTRCSAIHYRAQVWPDYPGFATADIEVEFVGLTAMEGRPLIVDHQGVIRNPFMKPAPLLLTFPRDAESDGALEAIMADPNVTVEMIQEGLRRIKAAPEWVRRIAYSRDKAQQLLNSWRKDDEDRRQYRDDTGDRFDADTPRPRAHTDRFLKSVERSPISGSALIIEEEERVKETHGAHALQYSITTLQPELNGKIRMQSQNGLHIDTGDAIGFPIYPDYIVRNLTLELTLHGLEPIGKLGTDPMLLRRFIWHAVPKTHSQRVFGEPRQEGNKYTLGPLKFLAPGFAFVISWAGLTPST